MVPAVKKVLQRTMVLGAGLLGAGGLWAAGDAMRSAEVEAITRDMKLVANADLDVDGDGTPEEVFFFKDGTNGGGFYAVRTKGKLLKQVACVYLEGHTPTEATVAGKDLTLTLEKEEKPLTLTMGKDVGITGGEGDPFADPKIVASSSLKGADHAPGNVFDGDLGTSWSEGKDGTGIGETLSVEFRKPAAVGLMGVFNGRGTNAKDFKDVNRVRKAVVEVSTPSNVGDSSANLDFADLGIDSGGHKVEASFNNRPEFRWFRVTEEDVLRLTIHVESVFLGDRKDDTHISEVAFCQMLADTKVKQLLKRKRPAAAKP